MSKNLKIDVSEEIKVAGNIDLTLKVDEKLATGLKPMHVDKFALEKARELIRMNIRLIKEEKNAIPA